MPQNITHSDAASTSPSYAEQMVSILETALKQNAGIVSVVVGGTQIRYARKQALDELRYWKRIVGAEKGTRPRVASINLS